MSCSATRSAAAAVNRPASVETVLQRKNSAFSVAVLSPNPPIAEGFRNCYPEVKGSSVRTTEEVWKRGRSDFCRGTFKRLVEAARSLSSLATPASCNTGVSMFLCRWSAIHLAHLRNFTLKTLVVPASFQVLKEDRRQDNTPVMTTSEFAWSHVIESHVRQQWLRCFCCRQAGKKLSCHGL